MRAVCFAPNKRRMILIKADTFSPIKIRGYTKMPTLHDESVQELKLNKYCVYEDPEPSDVPFQYQDINTNNIVPIKDVSSTSTYQYITVKGKLMISFIPQAIKKNIRQNSATVTDATSSIRIFLWDSKKDLVKTDNFYIFMNVQVRVYEGRKFLSTTNSTTVKPLDSFPASAVKDDEFLTIQHAVNNGVENFNHCYSCYSCNKKVADITTTTKIIRCTNCKVTQLLTKCPTKYSAKLIVSADNQAKLYLSIFDNWISSLLPTTFTSHTTITTSASHHTDDDALCAPLSLPRLTITYNKYSRFVTTVTKEGNDQDSL